jgi:hypothetical protein
LEFHEIYFKKRLKNKHDNKKNREKGFMIPGFPQKGFYERGFDVAGLEFYVF